MLRDTTERPEGIEAGTLKLAGTDEETIYGLSQELLTDEEVYQRMARASNPYGDGKASRRIAEAIPYHFGRIGVRLDVSGVMPHTFLLEG